MKKALILVAVAVAAFAVAQERPEQIDKKDLPKTAVATFCGTEGKTELERPNVGYRYKGKSYYFCDQPATKAFLKDPEGFLPLPLPRPMAKFDLKDLAGKTWTAEAFKDKVVLIDFWATWCGPCKQVKPIIAEQASKHKELVVLSVSIDEKRADLEKFLAKEKFVGPVLHDTAQVWAAWRVKAIPMLFLVKNGQVIAQWTGVPDKKELAAAVESAVKR